MGVSIYRPAAASEAMVRDRLAHHVPAAGVQTLASRSMRASCMTQHSWCRLQRATSQPVDRAMRSTNLHLHYIIIAHSACAGCVRKGFAFSAYWPYEPEFTRRAFRATAANAKAAGLSGRNVVPYVSLGAA